MNTTDTKLRFWRCCILLGLTLSSGIIAQTPPPRQYVISHWGMDDGLPQSSVNDVLQTGDGYLWLATFGGLVRFDGVEFTVFDRSNSPGMISDRCVRLFEDRSGALWISTEQGIVRKDGSGFTTVTDDKGENIFGRVMQDRRGRIIVTDRKLLLFAEGAWTMPRVTEDGPLRARAMKGEADLYFAMGSDVIAQIGDSFIRCIDMHAYSSFNPWNIIRSADGALWVATNGSGIFQFHNNTVKRYTMRDGLPSDNLQHLLMDRDGNIWGAGNGGAARLTGGDIVRLTKQEGLSDVHLTGIIQDHEGNYWAGTVSQGLNKIQKAAVTMYDERQGLREERLLSLAVKNDGGLHIGTNGGGDMELDHGIISRPRFPLYDRNAFVWSILEDDQGRVWGVKDGAVFFQSAKERRFFPGFPGGFLFVIYQDRNGTMWFGCSNGLFRLLDGRFTAFTTADGLTSNEVRALFQDRDGTLWIGTVNGLNRFRNGMIEQAAEIPGLTSRYFRAIHQDRDGILWFGTYGGGLVRLNEGKFDIFSAADGMFDNIVSHIVEDDSGYFWMGSNRGIARVRREELNRYAHHRDQPFRVMTFGKREGMTTVETNGGFQPAAVKDAAGRIYFPTVEGLAVIDPLAVTVNTIPPQVHIEQFSIDGTPTRLQRSDIPHDSSSIEIRYTALSYADPSKVRFRYRIDGYHAEWIDAGTRRTAYFTNMPPGEYRFQVIASNNDGYWNEQGALLAFTVLPPFWMTWWFRGGSSLLFIGAIVWIVRYNEQRKVREKIRAMEKAAAVERERLRIARDLHDELGARLTEIGLMTDLARKERTKKETGEQLENIGATARGIVESFREIVWAVNPQQDTLDGLIDFLEQYVQRFLQRTGIRCRLNIASDIPVIPLASDQRHGLFMAVKESLNNVAKHARATEVRFTVRMETAAVVMTIEDNGRGFAVEDVGQFSNGLANMQQRLRDLNGTAEITSVPKKGTTVKFMVTLG